MRRICFYHAGCPDGFGAAWAVRQAWGDTASYIPRGHDDPLIAERHAGDVVVFVDITPSNEHLRDLTRVVDQVTVLDHHVSSRNRIDADLELQNLTSEAGHLIHFDLSHSGAVLAWEHFLEDRPVPELLRYVEDQDLWAWKLQDSEEVNAALGSYPRRFEEWDRLAEVPVAKLAEEGRLILRAQRMEVLRVLRNVTPVRLGSMRVDAVNAVFLRSTIGHELAQRATHGAPLGLVYRLVGDRIFCTLYSIGELDVAELAGRYGGGGHRNAAGFQVSLAEWLERFL